MTNENKILKSFFARLQESRLSSAFYFQCNADSIPNFNFVRSAFWLGNKLIKSACFDDEAEGTAKTFDIHKQNA